MRRISSKNKFIMAIMWIIVICLAGIMIVYFLDTKKEKVPVKEEVKEEVKTDINNIETNEKIYTNVTGNFYQDIVLVNHPDDLTVLVNKNYALPNNYKPQDLVLVNVPRYRPDDSNEANYLRKPAADALEKLFTEAKNKGYEFVARSGYRSYETQVKLYDRYVFSEGKESADTYSARPGHSEHQTGLTMDITSPVVGNGLEEEFGATAEGQWIKENSHLFGFIIRYPQEQVFRTGYQYEPWHLRYVGVDVATQIYENNWILEDYILEYDLVKSL